MVFSLFGVGWTFHFITYKVNLVCFMVMFFLLAPISNKLMEYFGHARSTHFNHLYTTENYKKHVRFGYFKSAWLFKTNIEKIDHRNSQNLPKLN
jgi:hypothetical protein